jgi:hypothetical protein
LAAVEKLYTQGKMIFSTQFQNYFRKRFARLFRETHARLLFVFGIIDGSRIPASWMRHDCGMFNERPGNLAEFVKVRQASLGSDQRQLATAPTGPLARASMGRIPRTNFLAW